MAEAEQKKANADRFLELVRRYTAEIEKLTQTIIHEFVYRIIVHEP
ncbi:MAG: DUF4368 domain-containing protein [Clostridiales bacterium]|nr:DUF4368 domain-containing protein [Clostridiales bacterium]